LKDLLNLFGAEKIFFNEELKNHTTFKIGGSADYFLMPQNIDDIKNGIKYAKENNIPFFVLGNGSNILVSDKGYKGMIIKFGKQFKNIDLIDENRIYADSGALLSEVANFALENDLKGFEFASGIPGSFGGGIFMNAGAYGGEMKSVIKSVRVLDTDTLDIFDIDVRDMQFGYRKSKIQNSNLIICGGVIELEKGNHNEILELMNDLNSRRREKQPLEFPSGGSTFKRPDGYFAGKLIMDSNLAGFTIGGAQVSEKHCGFVINIGDATSADVLKLIEHIKKVVFDNYDVELESEVRFLELHDE